MSDINVDTTSAQSSSLSQKPSANETKEASKKPPRRRHNRERKHTKSLNVDGLINGPSGNENKKQQTNNLDQSRKQQQQSSSNKTDNSNIIKINVIRQNSNEIKRNMGGSDLSSSLNETNMKATNDLINSKKAVSTNSITTNEFNSNQNASTDTAHASKNSAMTKLSSANKAVTVSVLQNNMYEPNYNNTYQMNLVKTRTVYSSNEQNNHHYHQQQQQPQWQNNELSVEFLKDLEKNYIVKLKNVNYFFII